MAGFHIEQPGIKISGKDDNFTPQRSDIENHVRCDLKAPDVSLTVDFSEAEVMTMLSIAFPTYMPTMDAAYRFMKSNPKTSAEMMAEIACQEMTDEEIARIQRDRFAETQPEGTAKFDELTAHDRVWLTARITNLRETLELMGVKFQ